MGGWEAKCWHHWQRGKGLKPIDDNHWQSGEEGSRPPPKKKKKYGWYNLWTVLKFLLLYHSLFQTCYNPSLGKTFYLQSILSRFYSHTNMICGLNIYQQMRWIWHTIFLQHSSFRETVPLLTSDMGKKTVLVPAHLFFLSQRANSGYILSISPPVVLLKLALYWSWNQCAKGMFCPFGLNEWRWPLQLNKICSSTLI